MKANLSNGKLVLEGTIDLTTGRGFGSMLGGLPEDFLAGTPSEVLSTIAMRYWHPIASRANKWSSAVFELALYATGVEDLQLDKQTFRRLERVVRDYKSRMTNFNEGNANVARYVLKHAVKRAKGDNLI